MDERQLLRAYADHGNEDLTYYRALALHPDGGVLIGGSFRTSADAGKIGVARLWGDAPRLRLALAREAADVLLTWTGGEAGISVIEASEDLRNWIPVGMLTNGATPAIHRIQMRLDGPQIFRARVP